MIITYTIGMILGRKAWYQNGQYHRTNGPAIEWDDGTKEWHQNDQLHRLDGPAVECSTGTKYWFIDGSEYTEKAYMARLVDTYTPSEYPSTPPMQHLLPLTLNMATKIGKTKRLF